MVLSIMAKTLNSTLVIMWEYQNTQIFLWRATLQVHLRKLLWSKKEKILHHRHMLLVIYGDILNNNLTARTKICWANRGLFGGLVCNRSWFWINCKLTFSLSDNLNKLKMKIMPLICVHLLNKLGFYWGIIFFLISVTSFSIL